MMVHPELLEILACPTEHHAPLDYDAAADELLCTVCDLAFPIRDGIPDLLIDDARHRGSGTAAPA